MTNCTPIGANSILGSFSHAINYNGSDMVCNDHCFFNLNIRGETMENILTRLDLYHNTFLDCEQHVGSVSIFDDRNSRLVDIEKVKKLITAMPADISYDDFWDQLSTIAYDGISW